MHTVTAIRRPAYRYHSARPAGEGIAVTEWAVEVQLGLAHDYGEPNLRSVLLAFRPELDETLGHQLDDLLDLAEEVEDAECVGPAAYHHAVDQYKDALYALACTLRGTR